MSLPDRPNGRKTERDSVNGDPATELPDVTGMPNGEAAEAYAKAGIHIVPIRLGTKNPGSYLGAGWPARASCDLDTVRDWWRRWPDAGIAMHVGGSRLLVIDVDNPANVPDWLWKLLDTAVFRPTTTDPTSRRGHYLCRLRPGDRFGGGLGKLKPLKGRGWGEVRCYGGAIVLAPTVHPRAAEGGHYGTGPSEPIPLLPDEIANMLNSAPDTDEQRSLTPGELDENAKRFLISYTDDREPHALGPILRGFDPTPGGRHGSMWDTLCWALREGKAGCFPARRAIDQLRELWARAFGGEGRVPDADEFERMVRDAVAVADQDSVEELRARKGGFTCVETYRMAQKAIEEGQQIRDQDEAFWTARPELERLRTFARSRCVGPWSMLGAVLARVIATIPPNVVLPPTIGSEASVNLFVALVAPSGFGKNASEEAAADFLDSEAWVHVATPGSGEGILKQYAYKKKTEQINVRNSVMFSVGEVDTFAALKARGGSTLMPELRKAWMGERLGFAWADVEKAVVVMGHRYRMSMIVGVQPGRSRTLLEDADGGTPQRYIWLPTTDPDAPDEPPAEPDALRLPAWPKGGEPEQAPTGTDGVTLNFKAELNEYNLEIPADKSAFHVLSLPPSVVETIVSAV